MEKEIALQNAITDAEANLNYMAIFRQETGEEAIVHLEAGMTIDDACERYPEWSFRGTEVVRDSAWYEYEEARQNYRHWHDTKDMSDEEYDDYMDSLISDYELEDCYDY